VLRFRARVTAEKQRTKEDQGAMLKGRIEGRSHCIHEIVNVNHWRYELTLSPKNWNMAAL
jgi:hypothetical protein